MPSHLALPALAALLASAAHAAAATLAAFPGAEGFGAATSAGRGSTDVYHVTSLADTNTPGTFRYGVTHAPSNNAPRTIVFDVGGLITLSGRLSITVPNLTIAGQTAPGEGITLTGWDTTVSASNVSLRYLRFRPTDVNGPLNKAAPNYQGDSLSITGGSSNIVSNIIVDHVSTSWSIDENLSTTWANNVTVQNSIIAEALNNAGHDNGSGGTETHAYGSLIRYGSGQITYAHNLYSSNRSRNPRVGDNLTLEFVNNVTYNWNGMNGYSGAADEGITKINYIGNYGIAGPSTTSHKSDVFTGGSTNTRIYQAGNAVDGNVNGTLDGTDTGWAMFTGTYTRMAVPFASGPIAPQIDTALGAYNGIVQGVGASLVRDANDTRILNNLIHQTGTIIDSQTQVGFVSPSAVARPAGFDSDNDGVPNTWETAHGMNAASFDSQKLNPLGYTMLEQYLNELALSSTPVRTWTAPSGEWSTAANWGTRPTQYDLASVQATGANALVAVTTAAPTPPTALQLFIGGGTGGTAKVQVASGGTLRVVDTIFVGNAGPGTLQIDAGTVQSLYVVLGNTVGGTTSSGTLTLNGGTLKTRLIALGGGSPSAWTAGGRILFNGGTLLCADNLTNNAPVTLGGAATVDTDGYNATFSGALSGVGGLTKAGAGTLTLAGPASYTGPTSITGTLLITSTGSAIGTVSGPGTLHVAAGKTLTTDTVTAATWQIDGTHILRAPGASKLAAANFTLAGAPGAWTGRLDLTTSALVLTAPDATSQAVLITQLKNQIASGKANGAWTGPGITSSTMTSSSFAAANTLALVDASDLDLTSFRGQSGLDANATIVTVAHNGDATLDGKVDSFDLNLLAANWQSSGKLWSGGDFTGDGVVDSFDLNVLAANWQFGTSGGGSLTAALATFPIFAGTPVPEPATAALLVFAPLLATRRRRPMRQPG
jgi:autotransporter-associated beta strand protein